MVAVAAELASPESGKSLGGLRTRLAALGATDLAMLQIVDEAPLCEPEKFAAAGHLRSIFSEEAAARSFLADDAAVGRAVKLRRTLASSLLLCLRMRGPLPASLRHAYGLFEQAHVEALAQAAASGAVTEDDLMLLAFNGDLIGAALQHPCISAPLSFETSLGSTRRAAAAAPPPSVQARACGRAFQVITTNGYELWRATNFAALEPETVDWLANGPGRGGVLVDVGANIGIFTLCAAAFAPDATVIAIEPEPQNFARLGENIALNGFANVTAYPLALSDQQGLARFSARDPVPGSAAPFAMGEGAAAARVSGCVVQTLDWLIDHAAPGGPTQIKIDVDGGQLSVLRGAARTLGKPELRSVLVELFDDEAAAVDALMAQAGLAPAGVWPHTPPIGDRGRVANRIYERRAG